MFGRWLIASMASLGSLLQKLNGSGRQTMLREIHFHPCYVFVSSLSFDYRALRSICDFYVIVISGMTEKTYVDLSYSNPLPDIEKTAGETHQAVKKELVLKGIFPDSDSIPTDLISYVIESWGQVYDAGYADGRAARHH